MFSKNKRDNFKHDDDNKENFDPNQKTNIRKFYGDYKTQLVGSRVYKAIDKHKQTNITSIKERTRPILNNSGCQSLRINFRPTEEDDRDFDKCISLLKKFLEKYQIQNMQMETPVNTKDTLEELEHEKNCKNDISYWQNQKIKEAFFVQGLSNVQETDTSKLDMTGLQIWKDKKGVRPDKIKLHGQSTNAEQLCSQMEAWDLKHPKSMDPPGRVPPLTHAILQRKTQER